MLGVLELKHTFGNTTALRQRRTAYLSHICIRLKNSSLDLESLTIWSTQAD